MKNGIIYKITCIANGKCYIGQTFQPIEQRWAGHKRGNGNIPLYDDIRKYGLEMFKFEILHEGIDCPDVLNEIETLLIASHNSIKKGYNRSRKQGGHLLSDVWEHANEICRLYTIEKKSLARIASQFDTSKVMIMRILEVNQIKRREKSQAWEHSEEICRLYTEELKSLAEIANIFEVSEKTISNILKKHNIKMRPRKQLDKLWEHQNEICRVYTVEMKTTGEIAEMYDTNRMQIHRILKANNIKTKYRGRPKRQRIVKRKKKIPVEKFSDFIVHLHSEKQLSITEIAEKLSEPIETITEILNNKGL